MTVAQEQDQFEKEKAEQFVAETPRMPGVEKVRVELGEDFTGDPAMWLIFKLNPALNFDNAKAKEFNAYASVIQLKIIDSGLKRFPYTKLE
jgi:hypothetical protein